MSVHKALLKIPSFACWIEVVWGGGVIWTNDAIFKAFVKLIVSPKQLCMPPSLFMLTAPSPLTHSVLKLQCHLGASLASLLPSSTDWLLWKAFAFTPPRAPAVPQQPYCIFLLKYHQGLFTVFRIKSEDIQGLWVSVPSCFGPLPNTPCTFPRPPVTWSEYQKTNSVPTHLLGSD